MDGVTVEADVLRVLLRVDGVTVAVDVPRRSERDDGAAPDGDLLFLGIFVTKNEQKSVFEIQYQNTTHSDFCPENWRVAQGEW